MLNQIPKSWPDAFTTLSIGFISILIVLAFDGDKAISMEQLYNRLAALDHLSTSASILVAFVMLFVSQFLGSHILALGEALALGLLGDEKKKRFKSRIDLCKDDPFASSMLQVAYTTFRLSCGSGVLLILLGNLVIAAYGFSSVIGGAACIIIGGLFIFRLSRYAFLAFDLTFFGEMHE